MPTRLRNRGLPPALLLSYLASISHAAFTNDFSAYPAISRSCLDTAASASGCSGSTVTEMNHCLCGNQGNFVLSTATCVGKIDADELDDVYEMLLTSCTDSKTPLGVSQAQFLDAGYNVASSTTSSRSSTGFYTSTTSTSTPTTTGSTSTTSYIPLTTYRSVANGVTVTVTKGIESVPTGTNVGKGSSSSSSSSSPDSSQDTKTGDDDGGHSKSAMAAGLVGGVAVLLAVLAFFCYKRKKDREARAGAAGANGKFAALSSATSLTNITNSPPQGQATQYQNVNDQRPSTSNTIGIAAGAGQWSQQQQQQSPNHHQQGQSSPQYWQQQNAPNQYGQPSGTWPSPVASSNGPTGAWGVSPVSQYPPGSSGGPPPSRDGNNTWNAHAVANGGTWNGQSLTHNGTQHGTWNSQQNATWNGQAMAAPIAPPQQQQQQQQQQQNMSPVFELPADHFHAVEADSTPIGPAQPVQATQPATQQQQHLQQQQQQQTQASSSIQSTPQQQLAQPAPAHHGMSRQVDDALQISRVELPPPRYTAPSSEWVSDVSDDKKFG